MVACPVLSLQGKEGECMYITLSDLIQFVIMLCAVATLVFICLKGK